MLDKVLHKDDDMLFMSILPNTMLHIKYIKMFPYHGDEVMEVGYEINGRNQLISYIV